MPLSDDLRKPPVQPSAAKTPAETSPGANGEDQKQEDPQAFIFARDRFPGPEECKQWLADNGYEEVEVMPGQEGDEPHVAILFEAECCEPDTAYREEVDQGVEVVACVRKSDAGEEEEKPPAEDAPAEEKPDAGQKAKNAAVADVPGPAVTSEDVGDDAMDEGEDAGEEEDGPKKPYGAEVLEGVHGHLCSVYCELEEAVGLLEHPKVLKYAEKMLKTFGAMKEELEGFAGQHYPDHFSGKTSEGEEVEEAEDDAEDDADEDVEEEGMDDDEVMEDAGGEEDEDEEGPKKKPGKKRPPSGVAASSRVPRRKAAIARKDVGVLSEAAGFLEELAGEENLKRSQKAACRLHARDLGELTTKYSSSSPASADVESGDEQTVKALLAEYEALATAFYEQTGVEL